jgi:hypothetical protein
MSDAKWTLALEILADNNKFRQSINSSQSSIKRLVTQARADFSGMGRAWNSTMGRFAQIGVGIGFGKILLDNARLEHSLTQIALAQGKTKAAGMTMKEALEHESIRTGVDTEGLKDTFNEFTRLTGSWDAASASIGSLNTAIAVTGAEGNELGRTLAVASDAFNIDLTKPKAASDLLNKMSAIGRGAGGLSNISSMMSSIAVPASMAGMGLDSTLKFIGMISQITKSPEQMMAYSENIMRLFTNLRTLGRMRGIKLFDEKGQRRDPLLVLKDIQTQYEKLNDKAKSKYLMHLMGNDPRAMRPLQFLFESGAVNSAKKLQDTLDKSADGLEKKLPQVINNAETQAKRLKEVLTHAADDFAEPINRTLANFIKGAIDKGNLKDVGGVGLGSAALGTLIATYFGGKWLKELGGSFGNMLGGKMGLVSGVAEGTLLKQAGITPVYVVNFSEFGGLNTGGFSGGKFEEYLPTAGTATPTKGDKAISMFGKSAIKWLGGLGVTGWTTMTLPVVGMALAGKYAHDQYMKKALAEKEWNKSKEIPESDKYNFSFENNNPIQNKIHLALFIGENGQVVSKTSGGAVDVTTDIKRGKFASKAVIDRMYTGSED